MPTGKVIPTGTVLAGRTSIGVYFCADWCGPCMSFTPILKQYYDERWACKGTNRVDPFEVILVSRCRTAATTEHLFSTMPWPAVPHIDSVGPRGDSLMSLYGITTLPALVLLDGTGAVVCQDGRVKVVNQQAGWGSTPTNPWQPVPDCDLPAVARQRPTGVHLLPDSRFDLRCAARPPGVPPAFNTTARDSQAMASRVGRQPTPPPDAAEH
jgi:nucleoredoxin